VKVFLGDQAYSVDSFCYPRGKLLDIYRRQKSSPSMATIPDEMDELSPITQAGFIEPLAFVSPDPEEEVINGIPVISSLVLLVPFF
jgi:PERQ amino acid-rich with GYF domain-containing protein